MDPAALYQEHAEKIEGITRAIAHRYRLSYTDRDDFLQEVRLHLLRNDARVLRGFRGGARFETYMWKIVNGLCATWTRRQGDRERFSSVLSDSGAEPDMLAPMPRPSLETRDTSARLGLALNGLIGRLSAPDRELLSLRFMQGMEAAQIAKSLGITRAAVFKRTERLLRRLHVSLVSLGFTRIDVARTLSAGIFEWPGTKLTPPDPPPRLQTPDSRLQTPSCSRPEVRNGSRCRGLGG